MKKNHYNSLMTSLTILLEKDNQLKHQEDHQLRQIKPIKPIKLIKPINHQEERLLNQLYPELIHPMERLILHYYLLTSMNRSVWYILICQEELLNK